MFKIDNPNKKLKFEIIILAISMLLYSYNNSGIYLNISVLIGIIMIILNKVNENLLLGFFLFPCINLFMKEGTFSYGIILFLLISIHYFCNRYKSLKVNKLILICLIIILIIESINFIGYLQSEIISAIRWAIIFIYGICILIDKRINLNYKECINITCISIILSVVLGIIIGYESSFRVNDLIIGRIEGMSGDPNWLGAIILITILSIINIMIVEKKWTYLNLIMIFILLSIGVCTLSRTFLLVSLGTLTLVILDSLLNNRYKVIKVILLCIVLSAVIVNIIPQLKVYILTMNERFSYAENLSDFTGSRSEILKNYISIIFNNPRVMLVGYGLVGFIRKANMTHGTHNTYVEMIMAWGGIGSIVFLGLLSRIFKNEIKKIESKTYYIYKFLPIIIMGIYFMGLQSIAKATVIYIFFIAVKNISYKLD